MYDGFGDDSDDEFSDTTICVLEKQQNVSSQIEYSMNEEIDSQFLTDQIDEFELKMKCLERVKIIQEDLTDQNLTPAEKTVNLTNLNVLNSILTNIRLNEKLKLGALHNGEYTDAIILQKQLVCNLVGQKECSELVKPITLTQMSSSSVPVSQDISNNSLLNISTNTQKCCSDENQQISNAPKETKSILKESKNNVKVSVAAQ